MIIMNVEIYGLNMEAQEPKVMMMIHGGVIMIIYGSVIVIMMMMIMMFNFSGERCRI